MDKAKKLTRMPYDMVVSDFDGTLLRTDFTVSPYTRDVITRFTQAGGIFVVCTGRMYASISQNLRKFGLGSTVTVAYNGAMICDSNTHEVLFHRPIPSAKALFQLQRLEGLPHNGIHIYADDTLYITKSTDFTQHYSHVHTVPVVETNEPLSATLEREGFDLSKILVQMTEKDAAEQLELSRARYGEQLGFSLSAPTYFEIMEKGINKGTALHALCQMFDVPVCRTLAFGDALNDVEMLENAGLGFAVQNAMPAVKLAAREICPSNDQDGVAQTIEKYCLAAL